MDKNKRIEWIDMAKGYGMLFVILAHLEIGQLASWIYSFHIPLFFFLSGYVFSNKRNFKEFANRKIKTMLIPYISLGSIIVAFSCGFRLYNGEYTISDALGHALKYIVQIRQSTLWFLACLFLLNFIFYFLSKAVKSNVHLIVISFLFMVAGYLYYYFGGKALPWNFDVCFMAIPFFAVGYISKLNSKKIDKILNIKSKQIIVLICFGVINVVCWYLNLRIAGKGMEMYGSSYGCVPITYLSAFAGIICVIMISKLLTISPIKYVGKNSLIYFAWHQSIAFPLINIFFAIIHKPIDSFGVPYIDVVIIFLLSIIILTICNEIISRTKLKFMLGK